MAKATTKHLPKKLIQFRKHNNLVEGKYKFDIWETRIFFKMLSQIDYESDKELFERKLSIPEMIEDFGVKKDKRAYERFLQGAEKLKSKPIEVYLSETDELLSTYLITATKRKLNIQVSDDKYIKVSFHPDLKEFLLQVKNNFTLLDFETMSKLPSSYSIRVYELMKRFLGQRKTHITRTDQLQELKRKLGVIERIEVDKNKPDSEINQEFENCINILSEDQRKIVEIDYYPLYGNFNQRVLKKAQTDLKKYTDIEFDYEPIKEKGKRNVSKIRFSVTRIEKDKKSQVTEAQTQLFDKLFPLVKDWKDVDELSISKLISKYDKNRISAAYSQTLQDSKTKEIKSMGKWFYNLVHNAPTLFDQRQVEQKDLKQKEEQRKNKEEKKMELEKELEKMKAKLREESKVVIDKLVSQDPELFDQAFDTTKRKHGKSNFYRNMTDSKLKKNKAFMASVHNQIKSTNPQEFIHANTLLKKIESVERKLSSL